MNLVISFRIGRWQLQIGERHRFNGVANERFAAGCVRVVSWATEYPAKCPL